MYSTHAMATTSTTDAPSPLAAVSHKANWCPRCDRPTLQEEVAGGVSIDRCVLCNGLWLDEGEFEALAARLLPARLRRRKRFAIVGRNAGGRS